MRFAELVETIRQKEKKHPYVISLEGLIGSGKSYEAEKLIEELDGKSLLISTDLFLIVPRAEWTNRIEEENIDLKEWYHLPKIKQTLESIKMQEQFTVTGLYNLSNGEFDDEVEVDARDCNYVILEGLFSCNKLFDDLVDLSVFLDVTPETALTRAHERDETVRHLDHNSWLQKRDIFYNHYLPYLEEHRKNADLILDPD